MSGPTQKIEEIQASEAPTLVKILHQHKVLTLIETRVTSGLGICPRIKLKNPKETAKNK